MDNSLKNLEAMVREKSLNFIVFLLFSSDDCYQCDSLYTNLKNFSKKEQKVSIIVVDAKKHFDVCWRLEIASVPTLHIYAQQQLLFVEKGSKTMRELNKILKKSIKKMEDH